MKLRATFTPVYVAGEPPMLQGDPVLVCDSVDLTHMLLKAWRHDAEREIRRQLYDEMYPGKRQPTGPLTVSADLPPSE